MTRILSLALACLLIVGCASTPSRNIVHVARNGDITLNGVATSRDDLPERLDGSVPLVIQAAPQTPYRDMVAITEIAQRAGIRNVSIAVEAVK